MALVRVTTSLFVSALIRRCFAADAAAVVVRHGADEAGAVFIAVDRLDGTSDLYGPAPQSLIDDDDTADRLFQRIREGAPSAEIDAAMERERKFDPDLWLVAIEDRHARPFVALAKD